jgi:2-dehydropantoate 2-reductase
VAAEPDQSTRFLVYGAGAVGSFLSARLALAGRPVTLLGRPAVRRVIHEQGLRLDRPDGSDTVRLPVITQIDDLTSTPDIVLLTVKACSIHDALPDLERLAGTGATMVTLQNGVGTEETLLERSSLQRLIAASLTISLAAEGPGRVRQETSNGGIALAAVHDLSEHIESLQQTLARVGIPAVVLADYHAMKWSKLLLNMLANATSAILAIDPGAIFADPALFRLEQRAFIEALAVMAGQGLTPQQLPGFNLPLLVYAMRLPPWLSRRLVGPRVASGRGDKRPSLWLDIESGRSETEVAWLNGAVAEHGRELGIPTPVNQALARLVDEIAHDPDRRRELAGHPRLLLKAVATPE